MKLTWEWIVTGLAAVCLLLILGGGARSDHHLIAAARCGCSAGVGRELLFLSPGRILPGASSTLIPSRAGPYQPVLTLDVFLLFPDAGPAGPPWLDERGPPGKFLGPWATCTAAGQAGKALKPHACENFRWLNG